MRVAIAIWPAPAHLYPLVPLAWALRAAGHEVYVVSHPVIGPTVCAQGLAFVPFCAESDMPALLGPGAPYPEERAELDQITRGLNIAPEMMGIWSAVTQFFLPSMWDFIPYRGSPSDPMPAMDGMVTFFKQWKPDLVIWDPCVPGAAVAARACGARHARYTGPDIVGWCMDTFDKGTAEAGAPALDSPFATVRPMAEKYDVPVDRETLFGQWTINPMPPAINLPVDTRIIPVRWISHANQESMPDWLFPVPERPRVALSLGMSVRSYLEADWNYVPVLLDALSELDIEVVATLNATQLTKVTTVPDNVRILDYVPLNQLMPTCSALIHHGGLATMITAGAARVPQLVVDFPDTDIAAATDEDGGVGVSRYVLAPTTGGYVNSMGAGEILDLSKPSGDAIREQVSRVLTEPSFRAGANLLCEDLLASPSPNDIVPLLEKLTLTV